jgi:hypothetical protein
MKIYLGAFFLYMAGSIAPVTREMYMCYGLEPITFLACGVFLLVLLPGVYLFYRGIKEIKCDSNLNKES